MYLTILPMSVIYMKNESERATQQARIPAHERSPVAVETETQKPKVPSFPLSSTTSQHVRAERQRDEGKRNKGRTNEFLGRAVKGRRRNSTLSDYTKKKKSDLTRNSSE